MEKEEELNKKIMAITIKILEKHNELSKFLDEMPITIPNENKPEINNKVLQEYYDSLLNVLNGYMLAHTAIVSSTNPNAAPNQLLRDAV
jgi:hypothetical protein